jgi:hypothetical protein
MKSIVYLANDNKCAFCQEKTDSNGEIIFEWATITADNPIPQYSEAMPEIVKSREATFWWLIDGDEFTTIAGTEKMNSSRQRNELPRVAGEA